MHPPDRPKIYHILHVDRLASVVSDGCLWCDAVMVDRPGTGSSIGMSEIKHRRLAELSLNSRPGLRVGECVPFYFCPRSVMLYLLSQANHPNLAYRGGQGPIVHLEADLRETVAWAETEGLRWAFTLSNAGSRYFEDRASLAQLDAVNWEAVAASKWSGPGISLAVKDGKQAEFLVERHFPWRLVQRLGVPSPQTYQLAAAAIPKTAHRPVIEMMPGWYY